MKVEITRSWTHPVKGKILSEGTKLELEDRFYNPAFMKQVKKSKAKK